MGRAHIAPVGAGDCAGIWYSPSQPWCESVDVRLLVTRGVDRARCFLLHPNWVSIGRLKLHSCVPVQMSMRRLCATHGLEAPKCVCLQAETGYRRKSKRERGEGDETVGVISVIGGDSDVGKNSAVLCPLCSIFMYQNYFKLMARYCKFNPCQARGSIF